MYSRYGKRLFDLVCVLPGLTILAPLFALVALAIRLDSRGPVFFLHQRVGQHMRPVTVFKFRTMVHNAAEIGPAVTAGDDPRKTRVGRFLRRYKIDELPQLLNVLSGSLSLVGPRPEVQKYVDAYPDRYRAILQQIKPGITDRAAIMFRHEEELLAGAEDVEAKYIHEVLPTKLEYYEAYCQRVTLANDLQLILQTLKILL